MPAGVEERDEKTSCDCGIESYREERDISMPENLLKIQTRTLGQLCEHSHAEWTA